jgi:hypothetical protein
VESSSTLPSLGARFSGESLDSAGSGDGTSRWHHFSPLGGRLEDLAPSYVTCWAGCTRIAVASWLTSDVRFSCGG